MPRDTKPEGTRKTHRDLRQKMLQRVHQRVSGGKKKEKAA